MNSAVQVADFCSAGGALRFSASTSLPAVSTGVRLPQVDGYNGLRKFGFGSFLVKNNRTWADVACQIGALPLTQAVAELVPAVEEGHAPAGSVISQQCQALTQAMPDTGSWHSILHDMQHLSSTPVVDANELLGRDLSTYNRLLRLGRLTECLVLLEDMKKEGLLDMDRIFQKRYFQECRTRKRVKEAQRFLNLIPQPSVSSYTQYISVCAAAADGEGAWRAFRACQTAGLHVDCSLYTALISAYCKSGQLESAFKIFHEMEAAGVEPNHVTYSALIDGCSKAKQVAKAFGVYGIMLTKNVKPDRVIFHTLAAACGNTESLDRAFDVLQDMKDANIEPDEHTMVIMIDACTRCKQVDRALGVYRVLRKKGVAVTAAPYTAAINACSITGSLPTALTIYKDMYKARVWPDELVFCALINVALKAKDAEKGFSMLEEMRTRRVAPTTRIYNHLLSLCCEFHMPERALELYSEMKAPTRTPNIVTYNTLMKTLCNAQNLQRALDVLDDMGRAGVPRNHRTYMTLLKGCADRNVSNVDVAFKLYHAADVEGKCINLANCDAMIDLCYEQIRKRADPPSFSFTVGRFPVDATMRTSRQKWAACAVAIYKQTLGAGVVPTRPLLSKVLGCLRKADKRDSSLSLGTAFAEDPLFMSRASGRVPFGLVEGAPRKSNLEDIYEPHAIALYEEAAELGVVPDVCATRPTSIDMDGMPTNAAEVCMLAFLTALRHSKPRMPDATEAKQPRVALLTIKLPAREAVAMLNGGEKQRKVRVADRSGQAIAALLRRLGISYMGYESFGKLHITSSAMEKWLVAQPALQTRGASPLRQGASRQRDSTLPGTRMPHGLIEQQRAIRMGTAQVFPLGGYHTQPFATWEEQLQRPAVHESAEAATKKKE